MIIFFNIFQVRLRESEMQALHEERSKRETLERKLQEETMLREELVQQQIKMRDHQVKQVYCFDQLKDLY